MVAYQRNDNNVYKCAGGRKTKFIKKFNENVETEFDLDLAITKIKEQFSDEEVISNYDEEILNWVEEDWADDYDSEYDWYIDHNNGEA